MLVNLIANPRPLGIVPHIVDTSAAGPGDIDVEVVCNGQLIRTNRSKIDVSRHRFTIIPETMADHIVNITFNYDKVPGLNYTHVNYAWVLSVFSMLSLTCVRGMGAVSFQFSPPPKHVTAIRVPSSHCIAMFMKNG